MFSRLLTAKSIYNGRRIPLQPLISLSVPFLGRLQLEWPRLCSPTSTPTGSPFFTPTQTFSSTPIATVLLSSMAAPGTPDFEDSQVTNGRSYLYQVEGINSNSVTGSAALSTSRAPYARPLRGRAGDGAEYSCQCLRPVLGYPTLKLSGFLLLDFPLCLYAFEYPRTN